MKVTANVVVEVNSEDLDKMMDDVEDTIQRQIRREVEQAIRESEAFHGLKMVIYHACIDAIRKEIADEFVNKIKGES